MLEWAGFLDILSYFNGKILLLMLCQSVKGNCEADCLETNCLALKCVMYGKKQHYNDRFQVVPGTNLDLGILLDIDCVQLY